MNNVKNVLFDFDGTLVDNQVFADTIKIIYNRKRNIKI